MVISICLHRSVYSAMWKWLGRLLILSVLSISAHGFADQVDPDGVLQIGEIKRLNGLVEDYERVKRAIERDSPSLAACDRAFQTWQATPRAAEELDFILGCAGKALSHVPVDWDTYRRAIVLLNVGSRSSEFVDLAKRVVEEPLPRELSLAQINALTTTLGTVGRQQLSGTEVNLLRWASASFWNDQKEHCLTLGDSSLIASLRSAAIRGIYYLPHAQSVPALKQLKTAIQAETADGTPGVAYTQARLLRLIDASLHDLSLQKRNRLPEDTFSRGYAYQGPGATIQVD